MKKKGSFDIQNYLVSILLFMGIMITFGTVAYNMGSSYGTIGGASISGEFKETYNKLDDIEGETSALENKLVNATTGTQDASTQFYGDALNSLKIIIPSLTISSTMVNEMGISLGIPIIWIRIFTTILIIMIITVIIYMIFNSRGT